jgi:hypothetical protein
MQRTLETMQTSATDLAEKLKEEGIKTAIEHADIEEPSWSEKAYQMLEQFLVDPANPRMKYQDTFLGEEVRQYAFIHGLENPPSKRAWGAIIVKAQKEGLIEFAGYGKTSNPKAHSTPAALWKRHAKA